MDCLAPIGSVYQAGTLSGNPIAVTAGLANLQLIQQDDFYQNLNNLSQQLTHGLSKLAHAKGLAFSADYIGGMFGFYFLENIPNSFNAVKQAEQIVFNKFFHNMLANSVFFSPSMFEAGFICSMHTPEVINQTLEIAEGAFAKL